MRIIDLKIGDLFVKQSNKAGERTVWQVISGTECVCLKDSLSGEMSKQILDRQLNYDQEVERTTAHDEQIDNDKLYHKERFWSKWLVCLVNGQKFEIDKSVENVDHPENGFIYLTSGQYIEYSELEYFAPCLPPISES